MKLYFLILLLFGTKAYGSTKFWGEFQAPEGHINELICPKELFITGISIRSDHWVDKITSIECCPKDKKLCATVEFNLGGNGGEIQNISCNGYVKSIGTSVLNWGALSQFFVECGDWLDEEKIERPSICTRNKPCGKTKGGYQKNLSCDSNKFINGLRAVTIDFKYAYGLQVHCI